MSFRPTLMCSSAASDAMASGGSARAAAAAAAAPSSKSAAPEENNHRKQNHCEIEKRRRNKMNHYITELASVLPAFSDTHQSAAKLDKLTVLRMAVQHAKSLRSSLCSFSSFHLRPSFLSSGDVLKNLILQMASREVQDNLFMVVTCDRGKVLFVSKSSKDILDQDQDELVGQSLFDILHKDDVNKVKEQISHFNLMPKELVVDSRTLQPVRSNQRQSYMRTQKTRTAASSTLQPGARRSFFCRIKSGRIWPPANQEQQQQQFQSQAQQSRASQQSQSAQRQQSSARASEPVAHTASANAAAAAATPPPQATASATASAGHAQHERKKEARAPLKCKSSSSPSSSSSSLSPSSSSSSPGSDLQAARCNRSTRKQATSGSSCGSSSSSSGNFSAGSSASPPGTSECSSSDNNNNSKHCKRNKSEASSLARRESANKHQKRSNETNRTTTVVALQATGGANQTDQLHHQTTASSRKAAGVGRERSYSRKQLRYILMHCTGYLKPITLNRNEWDENDDENDNDDELGAESASNYCASETGALVEDIAGCLVDKRRTINCLVAVCRRSIIERDLKPDRPLTFTCRYSMEGKFVFVDQRTTVALGYTPQQLIGTSHYAYCHKDSVNTFKECHRQCILKSEAVSSDIYQFKRANGQHMWLQTSLKSFRNPWTKFIDYIVANHTTAEGIHPRYNEGCVPTKFNRDMTCDASPASTSSISSCSMESYASGASIQVLLNQIERVKSGGLKYGAPDFNNKERGSSSARKSNDDSGNFSDLQSCSSISSQHSAASSADFLNIHNVNNFVNQAASSAAGQHGANNCQASNSTESSSSSGGGASQALARRNKHTATQQQQQQQHEQATIEAPFYSNKTSQSDQFEQTISSQNQQRADASCSSQAREQQQQAQDYQQATASGPDPSRLVLRSDAACQADEKSCDKLTMIEQAAPPHSQKLNNNTSFRQQFQQQQQQQQQDKTMSGILGEDATHCWMAAPRQLYSACQLSSNNQLVQRTSSLCTSHHAPAATANELDNQRASFVYQTNIMQTNQLNNQLPAQLGAIRNPVSGLQNYELIQQSPVEATGGYMDVGGGSGGEFHSSPQTSNNNGQLRMGQQQVMHQACQIAITTGASGLHRAEQQQVSQQQAAGMQQARAAQLVAASETCCNEERHRQQQQQQQQQAEDSMMIWNSSATNEGASSNVAGPYQNIIHNVIPGQMITNCQQQQQQQQASLAENGLINMEVGTSDSQTSAQTQHQQQIAHCQQCANYRCCLNQPSMMTNHHGDLNNLHLSSLAVDDLDENELLECLAACDPDAQLYNIQNNSYPQYNIYRD